MAPPRVRPKATWPDCWPQGTAVDVDTSRSAYLTAANASSCPEQAICNGKGKQGWKSDFRFFWPGSAYLGEFKAALLDHFVGAGKQ
jgi:hypothetical protein